MSTAIASISFWGYNTATHCNNQTTLFITTPSLGVGGHHHNHGTCYGVFALARREEEVVRRDVIMKQRQGRL